MYSLVLDLYNTVAEFPGNVDLFFLTKAQHQKMLLYMSWIFKIRLEICLETGGSTSIVARTSFFSHTTLLLPRDNLLILSLLTLEQFLMNL